MIEPTIEQKVSELRKAGWRRKTFWLWASPKGILYLGPNGAWKHMKGLYASI